jgi:hypothetical protein
MSNDSTVNCSPPYVSGEGPEQLSKQEEKMEEPTRKNPFWRQGDIYFVKVEEDSENATGTAVKSGIIAKGETTGHAHRVSPSAIAAGALLYLVGRSMFLRAPEQGAAIVHDEHRRIDLPKGLYAVVPQQEFDGLRWRQVLD